MIAASTLDFLRQLKANNHKDWFAAHKNEYEHAKANFKGLVTQILQEIPRLDADLARFTPEQCTFRINRDVRFAKDKSPYKTNLGAYFSIGGKSTFLAGYYLHIEPDASFMAAGNWQPPANELKKIRQEIDYNTDEFLGIVANKDLVATFPNKMAYDQLKTAPKGYDATHPAIEWLKMKSIIVTCSVSNDTLMKDDFLHQFMHLCQTAKPMVDFLNRAMTS